MPLLFQEKHFLIFGTTKYESQLKTFFCGQGKTTQKVQDLFCHSIVPSPSPLPHIANTNITIPPPTLPPTVSSATTPSLQPPPPCLCELLMISHVSQMAKCFWDHFQNHNETQLKTSHFSRNLYILHRKHFPPRPTECKFVLVRQFNGNWFHPHYHLLLQHHRTPIL